MEVGAGIKEKYLKQSTEVSLPFLYEGLEICNQADIQFRSSRNQRLTIELALVKLANLSEVQKKNPVSETIKVPESSKGELAPLVSEQKPIQSDEKPVSAAENNNGINSVVKKPAISIKDSLSGPLPQKDKQPEHPLPEPVTDSKPVQEEKTMDPDAIIKAWKDYAASLERSNPRIYSTLSNNRPSIKADGTVMLYLNNEAQHDNFVKNIRSDLIRFIQNSTGIKSLEILTEVAEVQQNGKKIYTAQDKLDFLMKKNPELGHLKSRFNLDFDD